jgi:hypothetical protein
MANDLTGPEAGLSPIVEIALGKLRGARDRGVFAFKGRGPRLRTNRRPRTLGGNGPMRS